MFEIHIIDSGYIMADGGAMFGAVPKRAWKRKYPVTENNLCPLAMRCMLAVSKDRKILIDTGIGNKNLNKISYYQPYDLICIKDALMLLGYTLGSITDVILTHLHFDHCGYATRIDSKGETVPTFPNAKYWLSQKQWNNFLSPNRLEKDSIFEENILPVFNAKQLFFIEKDVSIHEGFDLRLFDGHTEGQLVAYINTKDSIYAFPGDLIPTASHVALEWISAYDISAIISLKEKERFLSEAAKEGYTIIYCHDSTLQKSKIKKINNNFRVIR